MKIKKPFDLSYLSSLLQRRKRQGVKNIMCESNFGLSHFQYPLNGSIALLFDGSVITRDAIADINHVLTGTPPKNGGRLEGTH